VTRIRSAGISLIEFQMMALLFVVVVFGYIKMQQLIHNQQNILLQQFAVHNTLKNIRSAIESIPQNQWSVVANQVTLPTQCVVEHTCMQQVVNGSLQTASICNNEQWVQFQVQRQICTLQTLAVTATAINILCQNLCIPNQMHLELLWSDLLANTQTSVIAL